jgi:hypothetical protein
MPRTDKLYHAETHPMIIKMKDYVMSMEVDDLIKLQEEMSAELRNGPDRNFQLLSGTIGRVLKGADIEEYELCSLAWFLKTEKGL